MPTEELARDYGMFTKAGNTACQRIVNKVLKLPITAKDKEIYDLLAKEMHTVAIKHGEVWDTEVRSAIISRIERATGRDFSIYF